MKKTNLKKKIDKLYSEIIRSKGYCERCGKSGPLNAHHVIGRRNLATRWDLRNGICLCVGCHKFNKNSAHEDPVHFIEWFKTYRPDDYKYLLKKKNEINLYTIYELEEIYEKLREVKDDGQ